MALIANKYFTCKLWKRMPDSTTDTANTPIIFKAALISEKERTYNQRISNLFTPQTRQAIITDSKQIYEFNDGESVRGFVELQGDLYQIEKIQFDMVNISSLGGGKFSKEHNERNAIKIITLV